MAWAMVTMLGWALWSLFMGLGSQVGLGVAAVAAATEATVLIAVVLPMSRQFSWWGVAAGAAGGVAFVGFALAYRSGMKIGPLTAVTGTYPALTVLLAWLLLKERPSVREFMGVGLAAAAVVLLTWEEQ